MFRIKWLPILLAYTFIQFVRSSDCDGKSMNQSAYLDDDMKVYIQWRTNNTDLTMKVIGKTTGWLGIGFSPTGSMIKADIVLGWVKDGKAFLQDRHGQENQNGLPSIDSKQDYTLLYGKENDTHTEYCFVRKLTTCDENDYKIEKDTIKLIYAFNDEDPESEAEDAPQYHGQNRGTSNQNIIGKKYARPTGSDVKSIDFRMPNVTIPDGRDTYYWCQFFPLKDLLTKKNHLIGYEPIFQKGHEHLMHHLVVFQCIGNNIKTILENASATGFECYSAMSPIPFLQCQTNVLAWTVGSKGGFYPDNVGFPFVDKINDQDVYYMFDIHYNNPEKKSGLQDSSGLRLYFTEKLRPNEAGYLMFGVPLFNPYYLTIPPNQKDFIVPTHCEQNCLASNLNETGIRIFGYHFHTHLAGRIAKFRHFRNGTELEPIGNNLHYDFNYQEDVFLDEERLVMPGDSLTVECTYNTEGRNYTTVGGESTSEEMCGAFVLYYPFIKLVRCGSGINPADVNDLVGIKETYPVKSQIETIRIKEPSDFDNMTVAEYLKAYKWNENQASTLRKRVLRFDKIQQCTLSDGKSDPKAAKYNNYPKNFVPYEEKDVCAKTTK